MTVANIYHAKTPLSKLIEEATAGNDVIIARRGKRGVTANRRLQLL